MNNVFKCMKKTIKENKLISILLILIAIICILVSLIPPQILRIIIDDYLMIPEYKPIYGIAILYFAVIAIVGICELLKSALLIIFGERIVKTIRIAMVNKLIHLPYKFFSNNDTGKISSYFNNDVDTIQSMFTDGIISMFIDLFKVVGILVSIYLFSTNLCLVIICAAIAVIIISRFFQRRVLKAQVENRKCIAKVNNFIPETIDNIQMIKSYSIEPYMEDKYLDSINNSYKVVEKINFYDSIFSPIILIIKSIVICLVIILSTKSLNILGISIGAIAASIDLIGNIFKPIENLGMELQNIQQSIAGIKRINAFLNEEEDVVKNDTKAEDIMTCLKDGTIRFEDVDFGYDHNQLVLKDFNLNINAKETVTFMGRTGSGKSTCFKLVLGLLHPSKGKVCICNVETSQLQNSEKRDIFGYVEQSFHRIQGTIFDQITLNDDSIDEDMVIKALKVVGLYDYCLKLDKGIYTVVDEGTFSFGQCQLLSIARAIVKEPPIILLDEMSANLDVETEKEIVEILQIIGKDCTILSISHRLSSVLSNNRLVKIGD